MEIPFHLSACRSVCLFMHPPTYQFSSIQITRQYKAIHLSFSLYDNVQSMYSEAAYHWPDRTTSSLPFAPQVSQRAPKLSGARETQSGTAHRSKHGTYSADTDTYILYLSIYLSIYLSYLSMCVCPYDYSLHLFFLWLGNGPKVTQNWRSNRLNEIGYGCCNPLVSGAWLDDAEHDKSTWPWRFAWLQSWNSCHSAASKCFQQSRGSRA